MSVDRREKGKRLLLPGETPTVEKRTIKSTSAMLCAQKREEGVESGTNKD